jgi:4-hydroxythreonine-4-phosphate dehydrogenase
MPLPRLILTSGEPAGIGPDLCIAVADRPWACELIVACDATLLQARARQLGTATKISRWSTTAQPASHQPGELKVLHRATAATVQAGLLNPANSRYVLQQLDTAVQGCQRGEFDAVVTAPVQKSAINDAGFAFRGQTEYLAEATGVAQPVMMLVGGGLRVALATTHLPLAAVSATLSEALLEQVLRVLDSELRARFGIAAPRILVCGLNPHAGESGYLGREEIEIIAPTVARLRAQGMRLTGPAPADTAFTPRMLEQADAVLAMFHDQGLPVLKFAGFGAAVNVTLGLPIIRTSVDHGTALDLAGTGRADAGSLIAAIELALQMIGAPA